MLTPQITQWCEQLYAASTSPEAAKKALTQALADPVAIAEFMSPIKEWNEIICSGERLEIWHTCFLPNEPMPPHNHLVDTVLGLYQGEEWNGFYLETAQTIQLKSQRLLQPGDVVKLGPESIHAVWAQNNQPCHGIHLYFGDLSLTNRSVFNRHGKALPMSDDNLAALQQEMFAGPRPPY